MAARKKTYPSHDAILVATDIETEDVYVPQWGGTVRVRGMSGDDRAAFEKAATVDKPAGNRAARRGGQTETEVKADLRARIVAWCVVDETGARMFADEDIPALNGKSAAALERVMGVAMRLSGMRGEEDIDEMAKEMLEVPFVDSSSPSPAS